jgi:hypothetical protein
MTQQHNNRYHPPLQEDAARLPRMTPQMLTLDRRDEEDARTSPPHSHITTTTTTTHPGPFSWARHARLLGGGGEETGTEQGDAMTAYTSFDDESPTTHNNYTVQPGDATNNATMESTVPHAASSLLVVPTHGSAEWTFFYPSLETRAWAARRTSHASRFSRLLRQAPTNTTLATTASTGGASWHAFRERYEQLNYMVDPRFTTIPPETFTDLALTDEDETPPSVQAQRRRMRSDLVELSSLYFLHHGRLVLRVPTDHVRLLADPDVEPGIVAVEQRRVVRDEETNGYGDVCLEPLHYVLTVPEDLYQRVVSDMSYKPCCRADGKADIRLAYGLFVLLLLLLFFTTVE